MSKAGDYPEALASALTGLAPLNQHEKIDLADACGRVLTEPVTADRDLPPFNRAQMDGYAVRAVEVGRVDAFPVAATIHAGSSADVRVPPGQCIAIATGAALPDDVDAVIPHEKSDRGNPVRFVVNTARKGEAVHHRAADARKGDIVIEPATWLRSHHLGIAASVGRSRLLVNRRPRVTILTSGDEVVSIESMPKPHQIRNSNGLMARELFQRFGAEVIGHHHVQDEREPTVGAVGKALESSDLLITIGGISAGQRDHFPTAFESHDVGTSLKGAAIQPGGPVFVGRTLHGKVVIGLPGNPVSVLACACLFAWPIMRVLLGLPPDLPWREVTLSNEVKPNATRRAFRPATLNADGSAGVPAWAGSGDLAHTAPTDGLLELPVQSEPVAAGTRLRFLPWP